MPVGFWSSLAKYAVKLAVYALGHPEEVQRVLNVAKDLHKAKQA